MTALSTRFAIVGRSFPRETFPDLQQAYLAGREIGRVARQPRAVWQGQHEPVAMPERLRA